MKYILLSIVAITLNSCLVINSGSTSGGPLLNVSDKRVTLAKGEAKNMFILGFGSSDRDHLFEDAKNDMYVNYPLKNNEYYSNFTSDISHKYYFGLVFVNKISVSADVLRVGNVQNNINVLENRPVSTSENIDLTNGYAVGDEIYYEPKKSSLGKYIISSINGSILYLTSENGKRNVEVNTSENLFSTKKEVNGFKAGDEVKAKLFLSTDKYIITALSTTEALFKVEGEYYIRPISGLKK
ncbi:MAG: hypothetical protein Q8L81_19130 [Bacteroidota bacterium]|nr:hypothetical protein [Bacteroidota bacterium]